MKQVLATFDEAEPRFQTADLLLCRGTSWFSRGIRIASVSPYSHAGMLVERLDGWAVLDVLESRGGSSRPLRKTVKDFPGIWDLYKVNTVRFPEFNRNVAETRMWDFDAIDYGWGQILKAALIYLPGIRLFQKIDSLCIDNGATDKTPPFCSMAYAIACQAGGVDPVKNLRHSMTTPGHLAQSHLFDYVCTLVPDEASKAAA